MGSAQRGKFDTELTLQKFNDDCIAEMGTYLVTDLFLKGSEYAAGKLLDIAKTRPAQFVNGLIKLGISSKNTVLDICTFAKKKIPDSEADDLADYIVEIEDDIKWKELIDGNVVKRSIPDNLLALTKKVHGNRITSESIAKSKKALGTIADEFSDEQISDLIKLNYIASKEPLSDNPFTVSDSVLKEIRDYLSEISEKAGLPAKGTVMTKIQPIFWLKGVPLNPSGKSELPATIPIDPANRIIRNYVGRAEDFKSVSTKDLVWDYRFDYESTPFQSFIDNDCKDDMGYAVIKAKNDGNTTLYFATGSNGDTPPNTRTGMLGNDSQLIFEYKMDKRDLNNDDILEIYNKDGVKQGTYQYDKDKGQWVFIN